MRYITNADGYVVTVSFGGDIECDWGVCTEYTGAVPTGYTSLEAWYAGETEKLYRWKVVNGQLTMDSSATAPENKTIFDLIYPVGSIYLAYNHINPSTLFGGTWVRIEQRFLWAVGSDNATIGKTGGEYDHTLTIEEMPSHRHNYMVYDASGTDYSAEGNFGNVAAYASDKAKGWASYPSYTGGGAAHNNMPPFIQISAWRRTA